MSIRFTGSINVDGLITADPAENADNVVTLAQLESHTSNLTNPHQVTKTQVGLGNADNTSDINKPISTATQTALDLKIDLSQKAAPNGVAPLGSDSKVPAIYLPGYVDDIIEVTNYAALPVTGEADKLYVTQDTNKTYRWTGSSYVEVSPSDVNSVFGRTGIISALEADYSAFYPLLSGTYNNPSWINQLAWGKITGTPTTLAGYGITDALATGSAILNQTSVIQSAGFNIDGNGTIGTGLKVGTDFERTLDFKLHVSTELGENTVCFERKLNPGNGLGRGMELTWVSATGGAMQVGDGLGFIFAGYDTAGNYTTHSTLEAPVRSVATNQMLGSLQGWFADGTDLKANPSYLIDHVPYFNIYPKYRDVSSPYIFYGTESTKSASFGVKDVSVIFIDSSNEYVGIHNLTPLVELDVLGRGSFTRSAFNYVESNSLTSDSWFRLSYNSAKKWDIKNKSDESDILKWINASDVTAASLTQAGNFTATSLIKSGGTSSQFLKADGSVDATVYAPLDSPGLTGIPTAPTAAAGTNTTQLATTAFVLANVPALSGTSPIQYSGGVISILTASGSQNGALSSADWNTFNGKLSPTGSGSGLTGVMLLTGSQTATGNKTFSSTSTSFATSDGTEMLRITQSVFGADNTGTINFYSTNNAFVGVLTPYNWLTASRSWALPDASGTIMLTNGSGTAITDVVHISGTETITGAKTFTGNLTIAANALSSSANGIYQAVDNDYFKQYAYATVADRGEYVFETGDNGTPWSGTGQRWRYSYTAAAGGTAKDVFLIDYDLISTPNALTVEGALTGTTATFSTQLNLGGVLTNGADATSAINIKQAGNAAANGIYLERTGERTGYYMYIGGGLDALTFQRNYAGTKADVLALNRDGTITASGALTGTSATFSGGGTFSGISLLGGGVVIRNTGNSETYGGITRSENWNGVVGSNETALFAAAGYGVNFYSGGTATLKARLHAGDQFDFYVPLTGTTATFSGLITSTNSGQLFNRTGASTAGQYFDISNTTGRMWVGVDNSTGTSLITTGGVAYSTVLAAVGSNSIVLGTNGVNRYTIDASGNNTWTGTLLTNATGPVFTSNGATTERRYIVLSNTSATNYFGIEGSLAGSLLTGSSAYSTVIGSSSATSVHLGANGAVRYTIDASGNNTWTGTGHIGGSAAATNGRFEITGNNSTRLIYGQGGASFPGANSLVRYDAGGVVSFELLGSGAGTFASTVTATGFYESSDLRYKDIISRTPSASGFDMIAFKWKPELKRDNLLHYGYVAQEVQKFMPDQVQVDDKGFMSVNYTDVLVKKVADLEQEIKLLKLRLE